MAIATIQNHEERTAMLEKEGKYLTFALANEEYGLEILKVREIINYIEVTAVPQVPPLFKGVVNLRGQVIPVIDLRSKFGMATTASPSRPASSSSRSPGKAASSAPASSWITFRKYWISRAATLRKHLSSALP